MADNDREEDILTTGVDEDDLMKGGHTGGHLTGSGLTIIGTIVAYIVIVIFFILVMVYVESTAGRVAFLFLFLGVGVMLAKNEFDFKKLYSKQSA
jgi:hypothetical protein